MDDKEVYDVPLDESLLGDIPTAERIMEVVKSIEDETRAIMKEDVIPDPNAGLSDVDEKKLIS